MRIPFHCVGVGYLLNTGIRVTLRNPCTVLCIWNCYTLPYSRIAKRTCIVVSLKCCLLFPFFIMYDTLQVEWNDYSSQCGLQSGEDVLPVFLDNPEATSSYITELFDLLMLDLKPSVLSEHWSLSNHERTKSFFICYYWHLKVMSKSLRNQYEWLTELGEG